jgi:hypothetical protein
MPDLRFQAGAAEARGEEFFVPLMIVNAVPGETVRRIDLRWQAAIDAARRRYSAAEQERLFDLFCEPARWGETLRPVMWESGGTTVAEFGGSTQVEIPLARPADASHAVAKYLAALEGGEAPLVLLFRGMVFYDHGGSVQVAPIPWDREARCGISKGS